MKSVSRMNTVMLARGCLLLTLLAHIAALTLSGADAASAPISQLSRGEFGAVHTLGLVSLAIAWGLLARPLWQMTMGRLWQLAVALLLCSIGLLLYVAFYFAMASDAVLLGEQANDPLSLLASAVGVMMGAIQPALRRAQPSMSRVNLWILIAWLGLIPVIPFIETSWLGAYERTVGALMLLWSFVLTMIVVPPVARSGAEAA